MLQDLLFNNLREESCAILAQLWIIFYETSEWFHDKLSLIDFRFYCFFLVADNPHDECFVIFKTVFAVVYNQ